MYISVSRKQRENDTLLADSDSMIEPSRSRILKFTLESCTRAVRSCAGICPREYRTANYYSNASSRPYSGYEAIIKVADIRSGQRIFINGESTAVGAFAIQFAKIRGAQVTVSASSKNEECVRNLGADEFVDYTKVSRPEYLCEKGKTTNFDYILEAVGISGPSIYTETNAYLRSRRSF